MQLLDHWYYRRRMNLYAMAMIDAFCRRKGGWNKPRVPKMKRAIGAIRI